MSAPFQAWCVTVTETVAHDIDVLAPDADTACEAARRIWQQGNPNAFKSQSLGVTSVRAMASDGEPSTNELRAGWAAAAVSAFIEQTGCDQGIDSLHDLLADLGHLAEIEGYDFLDILARAVGTWQAERNCPDGIAPAPDVRIQIVEGGAS